MKQIKERTVRLLKIGNILVLFILVFTGCNYFNTDEQRADLGFDTNLATMEEPLRVFYDGTGDFLLKSFIAKNPEIKIDLVNCLPNLDNEFDIDEIINQYGIPDLIIGRNAISTYLPRWYKEGHIANLGEWSSNDESLDIEEYFPGTFDVFSSGEGVYALPLGITMDFMLMSESKYETSEFNKLEDEYTGRELLNVLVEEVQKEKDPGEFFSETNFSPLSFMYYLDGLSQNADAWEMDEELFKQVYDFTYCNMNVTEEASAFWDEQGKEFNSGYIGLSYLEPRRYEGNFTMSICTTGHAPALALSYAETAYQYFTDEGIKALYFPTADDGCKFIAEVNVWGAVGGESSRKRLAYDLLRALMDEEINIFGHVNGASAGASILNKNVYPINRKNALSYLDRFENQTSSIFYKEGIIIERDDVSGCEKEKHQKVLSNIVGLYCKSAALSEPDGVFYDYYDANISDYKNCYLDTLNALNNNMVTDLSFETDSTNVKREESSEVIENEYEEITDVSDIKDRIRDVKIGETFFFGEVEQDNDLSNGAEAIEWIVLKKTDSSAFVISKKVLEWMTFSEYKDQITVDGVEVTVPLNCFIWDIECNQQRAWLTNELYANGFSEIEKEVIVLSHIETQGWEVSDPESTDYLYIPSKEEVEEYLSDIHLKQAEMTAYVATKAEQMEGEYIRWSVRTEGPTQKYVMQVLESGKLSSTYCSFPNGVRPVMWLDIS